MSEEKIFLKGPPPKRPTRAPPSPPTVLPIFVNDTSPRRAEKKAKKSKNILPEFVGNIPDSPRKRKTVKIPRLPFGRYNHVDKRSDLTVSLPSFGDRSEKIKVFNYKDGKLVPTPQFVKAVSRGVIKAPPGMIVYQSAASGRATTRTKLFIAQPHNEKINPNVPLFSQEEEEFLQRRGLEVAGHFDEIHLKYTNPELSAEKLDQNAIRYRLARPKNIARMALEGGYLSKVIDVDSKYDETKQEKRADFHASVFAEPFMDILKTQIQLRKEVTYRIVFSISYSRNPEDPEDVRTHHINNPFELDEYTGENFRPYEQTAMNEAELAAQLGRMADMAFANFENHILEKASMAGGSFRLDRVELQVVQPVRQRRAGRDEEYVLSDEELSHPAILKGIYKRVYNPKNLFDKLGCFGLAVAAGLQFNELGEIKGDRLPLKKYLAQINMPAELEYEVQPTREMLDLFEESNPNISVNVYELVPLLELEQVERNIRPICARTMHPHRQHHINLLYLENDTQAHYMMIKHLAQMEFGSLEHKEVACPCCDERHKTRDELAKHKCNGNAANLGLLAAKPGEIYEIKRSFLTNQVPAEYVIYVSYISIRVDGVEHIVSYSIKGKLLDRISDRLVKGDEKSRQLYREMFRKLALDQPITYCGPYCAHKTIGELARLKNLAIGENGLLQRYRDELIWDEKSLNLPKDSCYICGVELIDGHLLQQPCADHYHASGEVIGWACKQCNSVRQLNQIKVVVESLAVPAIDLLDSLTKRQNYHQLKKLIGEPTKPICIDFTQIKMVDCHRFIPADVNAMIDDGLDVDDDFKELIRLKLPFYDDHRDFEVDDDNSTFPTQPGYYKDWVTLEDGSEQDVQRMQLLMKKYGDWETLLKMKATAHVEAIMQQFELMRIDFLSDGGCDPAHALTMYSANWRSYLIKCRPEFSLISDQKMLNLMPTVGGVNELCCHRFNTQNDQTKRWYIFDLDINGSYPYIMSKPLPCGNFRWVEPHLLEDLPSHWNDDPAVGYWCVANIVIPDDKKHNFFDLGIPRKDTTPESDKPILFYDTAPFFGSKFIDYQLLDSYIQLGAEVTILQAVSYDQRDQFSQYVVPIYNDGVKLKQSNPLRANIKKLRRNTIYGASAQKTESYNQNWFFTANEIRTKKHQQGKFIREQSELPEDGMFLIIVGENVPLSGGQYRMGKNKNKPYWGGDKVNNQTHELKDLMQTELKIKITGKRRGHFVAHTTADVLAAFHNKYPCFEFTEYVDQGCFNHSGPKSEQCVVDRPTYLGFTICDRAAARLYLARKAISDAFEGSKLLYCDTDSLWMAVPFELGTTWEMAQAKFKQRLHPHISISKALGDFKIDETREIVEFVVPRKKCYGYQTADGEWSCKGAIGKQHLEREYIQAVEGDESFEQEYGRRVQTMNVVEIKQQFRVVRSKLEGRRRMRNGNKYDSEPWDGEGSSLQPNTST
jgi:hypothetical protein